MLAESLLYAGIGLGLFLVAVGIIRLCGYAVELLLWPNDL